MGENQTKFKDILPVSLMSHALSLEPIGIDEYAWKWREALDVIEFLLKNGKFVLGGDVYLLESNRIIHGYDSWSVNKTNYKPTESDFQESWRVSTDYIRHYVKNNGEGYYFSIVAEFRFK